MGLQKEKDELQKTVLEKNEECMELQTSLSDKEKMSAELTRTIEELKEDIKRLQRLVQEKDDALGERESMDENTRQKVLSQTSELESKKEECAKEKEAKDRLSEELETKKEECTREREEKERISNKNLLLEKKLKATQTQVELLSGQKENLASETENLNKRLKEREEVITSFVAEKEKNVTEIGNLKRQLEAAEKKMAALKQSHQINGHSDDALTQIADGTDLELREDLAKKVKRIEALEHENAANQDYLQKVDVEACQKEKKLQEMKKKIHELKKRVKFQAEMLDVRNKEIERLSKILPKDSESEEEVDDKVEDKVDNKADNEVDGRNGNNRSLDATEQALRPGTQDRLKTKSSQKSPIPDYLGKSPAEILDMANQLKHEADIETNAKSKIQSYISVVVLYLRLYGYNEERLKQTLRLTQFVRNLTTAKSSSEELTKQLSIFKVLSLRAESIIDWHLRRENIDNSEANLVPLNHPSWKEADHLVSQFDSREFFVAVEKESSTLTPHSDFLDLAGYLTKALQKSSNVL